jgi:hypothetical protein
MYTYAISAAARCSRTTLARHITSVMPATGGTRWPWTSRSPRGGRCGSGSLILCAAFCVEKPSLTQKALDSFLRGSRPGCGAPPRSHRRLARIRREGRPSSRMGRVNVPAIRLAGFLRRQKWPCYTGGMTFPRSFAFALSDALPTRAGADAPPAPRRRSRGHLRACVDAVAGSPGATEVRSGGEVQSRREGREAHDRVWANSPCACGGAAGGLGAPRGPLRVCGHAWPVHRARFSGAPSRRALRRRRRDDDR